MFRYVHNLHTCLQCIKCSISAKLTLTEEQDHEAGRCLNAENIFQFVQLLHGVHQDDRDQGLILESLNQDTQMFVYYCTQLQLRDGSWQENLLLKLGNNMGYSLKVFLSIIVMESKFQTQILFFLQAVMKHLLR